MNKVFAVVELRFFISDGIDYAMAFNPDSDMNMFTNKEKAEAFFENRSEELSMFYHTELEIVQNDNIAKVHLWKRSNGYRTFLKLIELPVE